MKLIKNKKYLYYVVCTTSNGDNNGTSTVCTYIIRNSKIKNAVDIRMICADICAENNFNQAIITFFTLLDTFKE